MEVNVPGWESAIDPSTGRTYYINHLTQQTSWTPPMLDPLPDGWEERKDKQGRTFFYHVKTGRSQWDDPRIMGSKSKNNISSTADNNNTSLLPEDVQAILQRGMTEGFKDGHLNLSLK